MQRVVRVAAAARRDAHAASQHITSMTEAKQSSAREANENVNGDARAEFDRSSLFSLCARRLQPSSSLARVVCVPLMSSKRKSSESAAPELNHAADTAKHGAPSPKRPHKEHDTHAAAETVAASSVQPTDTLPAASSMSEHQRFMHQAYQVSSSSVPSRLSGKAASAAVASASPTLQEEKQLTPEQLAFVNSGLARWQETRTMWIAGRDDKAKQKRAAAMEAAAAAAAGSSSSAAAAAPSKTALPHPPSARPRSKYQATSDSDSPGDPYTMDSSSNSDSDSDAEDINKNIPAILAAREAYSEFQPRVKLSHMVEILQAVWEEEEDD